MIQFSLAKTRRRALRLSAMLAASAFLTVGISTVALAGYNQTTGIWDGSNGPTVIDLNTLTAPTYGGGKLNILDNAGGDVSVTLGDLATTSNNNFTINGLQFGGSTGAANAAAYTWTQGTLTIDGNVTVNTGNTGANSFTVASGSALLGSDALVKVSGSITDGAITGANQGVLVVSVGSEAGFAASALTVGKDLILLNDGTQGGGLYLPGSTSGVLLDSTNNSASLTVTGNLGSVTPTTAFNTPVQVTVGAGYAQSHINADLLNAAQGYDVDITAANITVSQLATSTTATNYLHIADTATPEGNRTNGNVDYSASGNFIANNVSVTIAPNLVDSASNVGAGGDWANWQNGVDGAVGLIYGDHGGGDISYKAGTDLALRINSFSDTRYIYDGAYAANDDGLSFDGSTVREDNQAVTGTWVPTGSNYDGHFSFTAGENLSVVWDTEGKTNAVTTDSAFSFVTGNQGSGMSFVADKYDAQVSYMNGAVTTDYYFANSAGGDGLSYTAGRHVIIDVDTLYFDDETHNGTISVVDGYNSLDTNNAANVVSAPGVSTNSGLHILANDDIVVQGTATNHGGIYYDGVINASTTTNVTGAGGMSMVAGSNISIQDDLDVDAGAGNVLITAGVLGVDRNTFDPDTDKLTFNKGQDSQGNITIGDDLYLATNNAGNILLIGKNATGSSIMTVGDYAELHVDDNPWSATEVTTGNVTLMVDNFAAADGLYLHLDNHTSGDITITASGALWSPVEELLGFYQAAGLNLNDEQIEGIDTALHNQWRYGFAPIEGSVLAAGGTGLYVDVESFAGTDNPTGVVTINTDNLVAYNLILDGPDAQIDLNVHEQGWWILGGNIVSLNSGLTDQLREFATNTNRLAFIGDATTLTRYNSDPVPGDVYDDVRVNSLLAYVPDATTVFLSSQENNIVTNTDAQNYEQRLADGSLYVGTGWDATYYDPVNNVNPHAVNEHTGFWTGTLVIGEGMYTHDQTLTGLIHDFAPTTLIIGDRLVVGSSGQVDIYDGGGIHFAYREIESLTDPTWDKTNGGNQNGHFMASHISANAVNYYFTNANTLIAEADADGDTKYAWNFTILDNDGVIRNDVHNVVISMEDPTLTYAGATDNLEDIGWKAEEFSTNLDDSPFFNITHGWLDDSKQAYVINGITWKTDADGTTHTLQNQAPTGALEGMVTVLEESKWGTGTSYNDYSGIIDLLYLSPDLGTYHKDLTQISAGSNLNAAYMVSHQVHKVAIDRVGEYNRLVASVAAQSGDAPATGYEQASAMNGLWITPYYQYKEMDDDFGNGVLGYDITSWGFVGGYDRQIIDQVRAGIYFGATQPKLEDNNGGNIDGKDFQIGVYGSWHDPNLFEVSLALGFGWQDYEADRNVMISRPGNTPYAERLWADYDGDSFDLVLEVAKPFFLENNIWLRPAVGYHFQSTSLDGFTENGVVFSGSGDSSVAQRVGDMDLDQHFFRLGLSAGWDSDMLGISGKLFWVGRSGDDRPEAGGQFIAPFSTTAYGPRGSESFLLQGAEADDSSINLGLNVNAYLNEEKTATFNVGFDTLLGSDEQAYMVNVGLSYQF